MLWVCFNSPGAEADRVFFDCFHSTPQFLCVRGRGDRNCVVFQNGKTMRLAVPGTVCECCQHTDRSNEDATPQQPLSGVLDNLEASTWVVYTLFCRNALQFWAKDRIIQPSCACLEKGKWGRSTKLNLTLRTWNQVKRVNALFPPWRWGGSDPSVDAYLR
jgi:hypothetical protein